ncbi:aminotransferase class I/II-fold pyridoxal phosphate-dependent enzyme, partial [Burkholderia cenocepacia]|uniref:aminotransferase class I/II-fold pyridoxal phosphate-dependent enzyme n=2 Tax=Burkholderiaceae TaxID=119060 RepID=UPI001F4A1BB7
PAFARHGHRVVALDIHADTLPATLRHVIVGNPNNPTAEFVPTARLLGWHAQLAARGGTLIVDEAFADTGAAPSLAPHADRPGLVVLRSVGKFFGLAGIRAGFVLACPTQIVALRDTLGAWTVGGPARHAVAAAFADRAWQAAARERLAANGERLAALLRAHGFAVRATPLFSWSDDPRASALHAALAAHGIWTRHFPAPSSVRIGLPASEAEWQRLGDALAHCVPLLQRASA